MSYLISPNKLPPLIEPSYAKTNGFLAALPAPQLADIIAAASNKIRRYCKRNFTLATYSKVFEGGLYPFNVFYLTEIPIVQITRLASNPCVVMNIQNTATTTYQRATAQTTATGLVLYQVASGFPTENVSITWNAYPTIQAVANAVNALGNGWLATPQVGYALNASADLQPSQGAITTLVGPGAGLIQYLECPTSGAGGGYDNYGLGQWAVSQGWRLDPGKGIIYGQFPPGQQNVRCDWQGGFAQVPDAVQEACLLTAVAIWGAGRINPFLKSENALDYGYTLNDKIRVIPSSAVSLLSEFVDHGAFLV